MIKFNVKVVNLKIEDIKKADINSNVCDENTKEKLRRSIQENGFTDPIKVRKTTGERSYECVDGHHRLEALRALGSEIVPAIILNADGNEARLDAIKFNTLRGEQNPKLLAQIIQQLQKEGGMSLDEISYRLIYDVEFLQDRLQLLELPSDIDDLIKKQQEQMEKDLPVIYSFIVPAEYKEFVDKTFDDELPGRKLGTICKKITGGEEK